MVFCYIATFLTKDAKSFFKFYTRSAIQITWVLKSKFRSFTNDTQLSINTISEPTSKSKLSFFFPFSVSFSTTRRMHEACSDLIQPTRLLRVFTSHGLLFFFFYYRIRSRILSLFILSNWPNFVFRNQ